MENETKLTFGEKLKQARKSAGLTQEQLAEKLMVSRQAVTKWESDRGLPDIGNIKQIVRLLDVSIDYLLDDGESLELSVTDEFIESRRLSGRISGKKFQIGDILFTDCGVMKR